MLPYEPRSYIKREGRENRPFDGLHRNEGSPLDGSTVVFVRLGLPASSYANEEDMTTTKHYSRKRWWIGCVRSNEVEGPAGIKCYSNVFRHFFKAFSSSVTPTEASHRGEYVYGIGPFKTKRAALWAEKYGYNNPHFRCVNDAEKLALRREEREV